MTRCEDRPYHDSPMRIEVLSFDGCPNVDGTEDSIARALAQQGCDAEIVRTKVDTPEQAAALRFLGSPSVRVNGEDVEPAANARTSFGLMCRTYADGDESTGAPPIAMIYAAIHRHAAIALPESSDILSNRVTSIAVYWLPALVLVASGFSNVGQELKGAIWALALTTMGVACVVNAVRCGRVHCYATGPFFLVMAVVSFLYGSGVAQLGPRGWGVLGLIVLVGAVAICYLPEALFGRYRRLG